MLLQGTIIAALLLGFIMAWVAGAIVCFGAFTAFLPKAGWLKRILLSGGVSALLAGLVFALDAWTGVDDLSLFTTYLVGSMCAAVLSIAYLIIRLLQTRN